MPLVLMVDCHNLLCNGEGQSMTLLSGRNDTHNLPVICCPNDHGGSIMSVTDEVTSTLRAQEHGHQPVVIYPIEGNGARPSHKGPGYSESDEMFTLNTIEHHAVCYPIQSHPMDSVIRICENGICPTVTAKMAKGSADSPLVMVKND